MIARSLVFGVFATALLLAAPAHARPAPPRGVWVTASGNLEVEIAPCGPKLCGVAVKVLANHAMAAGQTQSAAPATVGLKLLTGLAPVKPGTWKGRLFNRENGKTYDCLVQPLADGTLKVRAYVGTPLIGKDQVWRPARDR